MTSPGGDTRQVKILIAADVSAAIKAMSQVADATDNIGKAAAETSKRTSSVGDVLKGTLGAAGIQAGFDGIIGGFKSVVSSGVSFEQAQNQWQAVTGASSAQMSALADTARQLGSDVKLPGASATTATAAMLELAKGGLTAQQSMDAARGTMTLAAAAQIDGAQAAEIQANALNMFGLQADQAGRVANVLANVANKSSGEITDFSQGLAQAGTVAASFGWSIEDTTTYLGLMANAGIKGSDAGTSLKNTMGYLLKPSAEAAAAQKELGIQVRDASGNMISARDLTAQLAAAKLRMSDADFNAAAATAFGTDAVRTALVAAQAGTEGYDGMATSLNNVDGAAQAAAANSKGLSGVIDGFKNAVDDASQSLFTALSPSLQTVTTAAAGLVEPLSVALAPALGAVAQAATTSLAPALDGLAGFLGAISGPVTSLISTLGDLPGPVGSAVLALGGVIALRGPLTGAFASASGSLSTLLATLRGTAGAAAAGSAGLAGWVASVRAASGAAATFGAVARGALSVLGGPIGLAIIGVTTALSFFSSSTDDATVASVGFGAAIDENTGKLRENADAIIAKAAAEGGSFDAIEAIGGSVENYTSALKGNTDAQGTVHTLLLDQAAAALRNSDAWGRMVAQGKQTSANARDVASSILATGDAGNYASEQFDAVLLASQKFAADSEAIATAERRKGQEIRGSGDAARDAAGGVMTFEDALRQVQSASSDAEQTATPFADALKVMRSAASEADAASQFLAASLERLAGGQVTAETATRANEAAFREIGGAARDYAEAQQKVADKEAQLADLSAHLGEEYKGQTVTQTDLDRVSRELAEAKDGVAAADDRQFQAGVKAAQSATDMATAAYNAKAAQGDMAGGLADATRVMEEQRQKFIDSQVQINGGNIPAAEALADKYGLIPGNVTTTFEQKGIEDAFQKASDLNAALDLINNRTVRYQVVGTEVREFEYGYTPADLHASGGWIGLASGGFSNGASGWVSGPGGPTDDLVVAQGPGGKQVRVSPGEFVVRASQAMKNRALLEAINGGFMGFAAGGAVPGAPAGDAATTTVSAALTFPDPALFQESWDAIVKSTQEAWDSGINPVMTSLSKTNAKTGDEFVALDKGMVAPSWSGISGSVQGAWDRTISPTFASLNAGTEQGGIWQNWLRDQWSAAWRQNQDSTVRAVGGLVGGTFPTLNVGAQDVGSVQMGLAGTTTEAWTQIGAIIQSTYAGQIVPAWTGVKNFTTEMGGFFAGVRAGVSGATGQAVGDIAKIKGAIQDFFALVNVQIAAHADGGVVEGFATGGEITKGTGPRADDVLIRVSKGEYVVNAAATAQHRETLDAINYGGMPRFADGGLIGSKVKQPTQDYITGGVHKAIEAGVNKALAAFPMGYGGTVIMNGNITVDGITTGLPVGQRGEFIKAVASQMGTAYSWGGASPPLFDCSGLMSWGLAQAGRGVGRLTAEGFNSGFPHISPEKPGDLVTFDTGRLARGQAGHIGMVFDPGRKIMLHTDGAGPARAGDYASRGGLLGFVDPIGGAVGFAPQNSGGDPPAGGWLGQMLQKIKSGGAGAAASGSYNPAGGLDQWNDEILAALAFMGEPPSLLGTVKNQVRTESGGDPRAWNKWDRNFSLYGGSKGLVQVIDPTFRSYAMAPYNVDIWDPISNLIAGMNYARHTYGSIANGMQGHAYDTGGIWPHGTAGWNTSGGPEMVLKPWQWAAAQSAIQYVTNHANSGTTITGGQHGGVHIHGDLVSNGAAELRGELAYAALTARN